LETDVRHCDCPRPSPWSSPTTYSGVQTAGQGMRNVKAMSNGQMYKRRVLGGSNGGCKLVCFTTVITGPRNTKQRGAANSRTEDQGTWRGELQEASLRRSPVRGIPIHDLRNVASAMQGVDTAGLAAGTMRQRDRREGEGATCECTRVAMMTGVNIRLQLNTIARLGGRLQRNRPRAAAGRSAPACHI
jgi:hypothetical protein